LGEEILPFLEPLMARLMEALQSNKRELQEICLVSSAFFQGYKVLVLELL
jgi:hypothetical protein